jgi:hypothetical protein
MLQMDYHHDEFQLNTTELDGLKITFRKIELGIRFKTDGDFLTGIGDENSTCKSALITVSTEWTFQKPERNETDEQWSAVFETAIECVTG